VLVRRPSKSGLHFCSKPKCQNKKVAMLRELRIREQKRAAGELVQSESELRDQAILAFVAAVLDPRRTSCNHCGATGVLPGWSHRRADVPMQPCANSGPRSNELGNLGVPLTDLVMPHLAPKPAPAPEVPADWVPPHLEDLHGPAVPLEEPSAGPAGPTGKAPF